MMIENDTNYALLFKSQKQYSFAQTRNFARKFINDLPQDLQSSIYEELNRGVDLLRTEPQMLMYLYSFGQMHEAKLLYAFENMDKSVWESDEIAVVDYGCGQGLATIVLADFMQKNEIVLSKIKRITLIEPSEKCLKRAALHTSCFLQGAEVRCVNKYINDLCDEDIDAGDSTSTIHLFSNIIDIEEVDLQKLSELLIRCKNDYDQYICVGPMLNVERMDDFANSLGLPTHFTQEFGKGEFVADKTWTCAVRVCVNDKDSISDITFNELDSLIIKTKSTGTPVNICAESSQCEINDEYSKIRSIIDNFIDKPCEITSVNKLIIDCSKYLSSIKEKIGSTNDIYIKLSTIIARLALKHIDEELASILKSDSLTYHNIKKIITAYRVIENINAMDIESCFRNNEYKPYKDTILKTAPKSIFSSLRITATIDLRTEQEYYDSCKSLFDYKGYINKYKNGKYRQEALDKYNVLKTKFDKMQMEIKEKEFNIFKSCKSVSDYKNYLSKHPYGIYAERAKDKITEIERFKAIIFIALIVLAIVLLIVLLIVTNSFMLIARILAVAFIILCITSVFIGFFNGELEKQFDNEPLGCIGAIIFAAIFIFCFITEVLKL